MKKVLKILIFVLAALILLMGAYVIYVFVDYYRLEDKLPLPVSGAAEGEAQAGKDYTLVTYNIGFGAYSADYSFFLDGGKYAWAFSEEAVYENVGGAFDAVRELKPDFVLFQEVDKNSTRSYHVDQSKLVYDAFSDFSGVFSQNYDSPYLLYPITQPHGFAVAGIMTLSSCKIDSSLRRSLPVETGFMKFLDLDRCYSVSRIPVDNGKTLCLYNLHLSAYSSDGTIATKQLKLLVEDMSAEYAAGNYVVCGGDFNKDLLGNSGEIFGVSGEDQTWAQAFPFELLTKEFTLQVNRENPQPSARNADSPYDPETAFVLVLDGFITSENVSVSEVESVDTGFAYSDHNPVKMVFTLK